MSAKLLHGPRPCAFGGGVAIAELQDFAVSRTQGLSGGITALRKRVPAAMFALAALGTTAAANAATTPTVAQLLDAANAEYVVGGVPNGMTAFKVNGQPVTYTNESDGTSAQVWVTPQQQIIIAYQGTSGGEYVFINPMIFASQLVTDLQAFLTNSTPQAFKNALSFANNVLTWAGQQGYSPANVFVTGHSLGGWEAEYVAQHAGLGGIGFEAPCLRTTVAGNGANSNFFNTATYGSPVGSFGSDIQGDQPFSPPYVAGGGACPHYGSIVMLGTPGNQNQLSNEVANWGSWNIFLQAAALGNILALVVEYHLPGVQAYNLNVSLNPSWEPFDEIGNMSGPVYTGAGNYTIPQALQAASAAGILIQP